MTLDYKAKETKVLVFCVVLVVVTNGLVACSRNTEPKDIFPELESYQGKAVDLLILEGDRIVPHAIEKIKDKKTPKRIHIMFFLGNGEYKQALPVLRAIVEDKQDPNRDVILITIFQIESMIGIKYANLFKQDKGRLGEISGDILSNKPYLFERKSYFEAPRDHWFETNS